VAKFHRFIRVVCASGTMAVAVWASSRAIENWLGISKTARLIDLAISIPLGLMVLYASCRALRVPELDMSVNALAGPLGRRFPFLRDKISK
jgi:hypothetical protein